MLVPIKQIAGLLDALKTPFAVGTTPPENPVINQVWFDGTYLLIYTQDTNGPVWLHIT